MHLLIVSLMCCAFMLIGVRTVDAKSTGDVERVEAYKCPANVPSEAEGALLDAINEKRAELLIKLPNITSNNCVLAKEAFTSIFGARNHRGFEINSVFDDDWKEMLKREVSSKNNNGMINAAKSVGCAIKLKTSETDGSHHIDVECLFDDPPRSSPR